MLLGIGFVALAAAFAVREDQSSRHRAAVSALRQQEKATESERRQLQIGTAPSAEELRARRARDDSKVPWLPTLRAVESLAVDPVFLRSLAIDPAGRTVRFDAEATTFEEALAFAKSVDDESLFRPALLTAHEPVTDATNGKSFVRFQVSAKWNVAP